MAFSTEHRRFLLVHQAAVPAVFNLVLNAAIAWALMRGHAELELWGEAGVGPDLLITGFLLPFLTCLIVSRLVAKQVVRGDVAALTDPAPTPGGWPARSAFARGVWLGLLGMVLCGAPTVWLLAALDVAPWPVASFVAFKGLWAGALAALVTPVVAWWALARASFDASTGARAGAG